MSAYGHDQKNAHDGNSIVLKDMYRVTSSPTSQAPSKSKLIRSPGYTVSALPALSTQQSPPRRSNDLFSLYRSISWILGFREKFSLLLFIILGGALMGFCLSRCPSMNPKLSPSQTAPGEYFWFQRKVFNVNFMLHVYMSIIGGMFVGLQFLPGLRRRAILIHRINGYFCLFCLLPGNITGAIVAVKSFGGEINSQSAYYCLTIMIVGSGLIGFYNVKKQTRVHRKWMLRMVSYFGAAISGRLIMLAAHDIISNIGTYHSIWRCDEMLFLFTDTVTAQEQYPQCFGPDVDTSKVSITVLASLNGTVLNEASAMRVTMGMGLWVAIILHIIGTEIYIQKTEVLNHNRFGYALEPIDYNGNGQPIWDYNTANK